ncbi:MAG: ribonucleoside-diphosphate reductase, adenosylcobalamin-dependent [Spirochaeta sp. LUC14_002_19_P3]|nr:MAG: ribonucleoside-diphosphate reductase, adenosylcobalamin-dependent [Spirochaeta sp. LUC14_002_19_P3]
MSVTKEKTFIFKQPICEEIFTRKYMLHGEESPEEVFHGVAEEIAKPEELRDEYGEKFYNEIVSGRFIPAGRILANARPYSPMKNYNNCFTIDVEDSLESIYNSLTEDAVISKMGGGVGFDISKLRPKGDKLSRGGESSGVISFLRIFDQSAKTIMTGGQRRSAHIALLDISHPEIEEFITVKQGDSNKELTQFNISVKVTDEFIQAVEEDGDFNLHFGGKVYKTVKARDLYNKLAKNAYFHNEPGIFNSDIVQRYNNGYWAFQMDRVNPCGELVMPSYSLCCLAAMNLSAFVENPFSKDARFDFEGFSESVGLGIRFLDNVLDVTEYPLEKIKTFSKQWRRIGLGFTALGTAMSMLRIKYGAEESIQFASEMSRTLRDASYRASAALAAEKGAFPAFNKEKLLNAAFIKTLPEDIRQDIAEHGLRNIQMNTVAPTGTISLSVGQNCSSGIEPAFALQYERNIRVGRGDDVKTETVYDAAWLAWKELTGEDKAPPWMLTTADIDPYASIDLQAAIQENIDHSISKTLNLPPGTTFEQYKELFHYAYRKGLKGFTTFNPEGSMKGILEYSDKPKDATISRVAAPERPTELPCDIHRVTVKGKKYIIITGHLNGSLYEVFWIDVPDHDDVYINGFTGGIVRKIKKGRYDLILGTKNPRILLENFTKLYDSPNASLARLLSMSLRHGTPLQYIVDQLQKDTQFTDFERTISRVLKNYIRDGEEVIAGQKRCPDCETGLVFRDGCATCPACGWSKCK